jgi:hypothetical protein
VWTRCANMHMVLFLCRLHTTTLTRTPCSSCRLSMHNNAIHAATQLRLFGLACIYLFLASAIAFCFSCMRTGPWGHLQPHRDGNAQRFGRATRISGFHLHTAEGSATRVWYSYTITINHHLPRHPHQHLQDDNNSLALSPPGSPCVPYK